MSKSVIKDVETIKSIIKRACERTGGVFILKPTWVARTGITQPGKRLKIKTGDTSQILTVSERWLASTTFADNGAQNVNCPEDHGYSYIVVEEGYIKLADAIEYCRELMLGDSERKWDVLPKFFDNWHRIPLHLHPCQEHVKEGKTGKPESYHFPVELNMNRNAYPQTPLGIDPIFTDDEIMEHLLAYSEGDNHLTDLSNTINIVPGTGWFMPPCTLHAPGSLVTYELQAASDVSCIPESRVNEMPMPADILDKDLPVSVEKDGMEAVCRHILAMIHCEHSGNRDNFRQEYYRPPVEIFKNENGEQSFVIYRCGRRSEAVNPDLYSAKRTQVQSKKTLELRENAAFGAIVLRGTGTICVPGKEAVAIESVSMFDTQDDCYADEIFVTAAAAKHFSAKCTGSEPLAFYQHFASNSNPEAGSL